MRLSNFAPALLALSLAACSAEISSTGSTDREIADQTLQGKIGNAAWTFVKGKAVEADDEFDVTLYGESIADPCTSDTSATGDRILLSLPKTVSTVNLDLATFKTVTLVDFPTVDNIIAAEGKISVTAVSASEISAGLVAYFSEENTVSGKFTIPVCP